MFWWCLRRGGVYLVILNEVGCNKKVEDIVNEWGFVGFCVMY